ncbi:unnamed protein product [Tuber melanosporum]|uniref:DNA polymerase lambda n=1 Tax=Tuber melanosporum (strain Mel28) TaxID=656061 RepID=D5G9D0_TUBMM|nr:uncharacterized protein GSTUM_00003251001 [Tuber melanosporum]CAZ81123.1 unnamed protein product [Tuber melanosporum]
MIRDESLKTKKRFFEGLYSLDSIVEDDDLYEENPVSALLTTTKDPAIRSPRALPKLTRARTAATSSARPVSSSRAAVSRTLSLPAQKLHPSTVPNRPTPTLSTPTVVASSAQSKTSRPPGLHDSSTFTVTPSSRASATATHSSPPLPDMPLVHTPTPTAPPESSRMSVVGSGGSTKRKRSSKAAKQPTARDSQLVFSDLVFYFIPNDIRNPARKMRIQKAAEFGAFCINEWNDEFITHVIVESHFKYLDVLKYLKLEKLPENIIVVNHEYTGDCLHHGRILDHAQKIYEVHGRAPLSPPQAPAPPPCPSINETPSSPQSLQIKPSRRKKALESTQTSSHPPSSLSSSHPFEIDAPVPTRSDYVTSSAPEGMAPKDDLDMMIYEAKKIGPLPLEDEEESKSVEGIETTDDEQDSLELAKRQKTGKKGRRGKNDKPGRYLGTFQCLQKNDGNQMEDNPNQRTIEILSEMQRYYEMLKDTWRSLGYRKAIATLKKQDHRIRFANEARELPGIGDRIALKIEEIVRTDRLRRLDYTKMDPEDEALRLFLGIYGVGGVKAQKWVDAGYRTLDDIKAHARLTSSQQTGIEHYEDFQQRIPRDEVKQHGDIAMRVAHEIDAELKLEILGSYRRGAKDCGDIDIMITKEGAEAYAITGRISSPSIFFGFQLYIAIPRGSDSGTKWHGASKISSGPWRRIDFLVVPWAERGAALLYFTGNDIFNRSLRLLASKKGFRLNQSGLYKDVLRGKDRTKFTDGALMEGESEEKIFEILGVPYRPPEHRVC